MNFDNSVFNSASNLIKIEDIEIPVDISVFDEEAKILATLKNLKGLNNWEEIRSDKNFDLVEKDFSVGTRKVYIPKNVENNSDLQHSRGPAIQHDYDISFLVKEIDRKSVV